MSEGKRSDTLRVRLAPEVLERLEKAAERHGFPVASYAAFAIGRHLVEQENQQQAVRLGVLEASRRSVDTAFAQLDFAELARIADTLTDSVSHAQLKAPPPASAGA